MEWAETWSFVSGSAEDFTDDVAIFVFMFFRGDEFSLFFFLRDLKGLKVHFSHPFAEPPTFGSKRERGR